METRVTRTFEFIILAVLAALGGFEMALFISQKVAEASV
jgi:hypothetical protein